MSQGESTLGNLTGGTSQGRPDGAAAPIDEPVHDLETHQATLKSLDHVRKRSAILKEQGYPMLVEWMESERYPQTPLSERVTAARVRWELSHEGKSDDLEPLARVAGALSLSAISAATCPLLMAAEAMRALADAPKLVLSEPLMLCWYWVVRELFSTAPPDWRIGGARAAHGGWVSAYATYQAIAAIQALASSLDASARFFRELVRLEERLTDLANPRIPMAWRELETRRLALSSSATLRELAKQGSFEIPTPKGDSVERFLAFIEEPRELQQHVTSAALSADRNLQPRRSHRVLLSRQWRRLRHYDVELRR